MGCAGLLLLNRSVYRGAAIMTDPHEVPEQQFPLTAAAEPDTLINMQPMRRQLAACTAGNSSSTGGVLQLTPALEQMYSLLEQALQRVPGQQQQQQGRTAVDVAAIMEQATRTCWFGECACMCSLLCCARQQRPSGLGHLLGC